jgi:hypothetical protein
MTLIRMVNDCIPGMARPREVALFLPAGTRRTVFLNRTVRSMENLGN